MRFGVKNVDIPCDCFSTVLGIDSQMRRTRAICFPLSSLGGGVFLIAGGLPGSTSSHASRSQPVKGASTWSRCVIRTVCTNFDLED